MSFTRSTWSRNGRESGYSFILLFFKKKGDRMKGEVGKGFIFFLLFPSLFCRLPCPLCSITSANEARSRAQALVIRSHNSVVVDIRHTRELGPCISNNSLYRLTFFICFCVEIRILKNKKKKTKEGAGSGCRKELVRSL